MESTLLNSKIKKSSIITYDKLSKLKNKKNFILYGDNILEGISILNMLCEDNQILHFHAVCYTPIDEPIYVFKDKDTYYCIKVCGAYDKWKLPQKVFNVINYIDLPDYVLYSMNTNKAILAGENTETASVGNSQWQREGRKVAASKNEVPFIYQTFYSGKDESQDMIREPNALQVYNHIVYSVRYKVPSFVAYFENNFDGSTTRKRMPIDAKEIFIRYIKSIIISDVKKECVKIKKDCERNLYKLMISYLKEGKYSQGNIKDEPRLKNDFLIINKKVYDAIINHSNVFIEDLIKLLYGEDKNFFTKYPFDSLNYEVAKSWDCYADKTWIKEFSIL